MRTNATRNLSLLDLIAEEQHAQHHRQLQNELPNAPRGGCPGGARQGWELFFQRLGGVSSYQCINFDHNIETAHHPGKRQAIEEAYDYALLFELLPVAILQLRHPGRWLPARYRQMLIDHERRTAQTQR